MRALLAAQCFANDCMVLQMLVWFMADVRLDPTGWVVRTSPCSLALQRQARLEAENGGNLVADPPCSFFCSILYLIALKHYRMGFYLAASADFQIDRTTIEVVPNGFFIRDDWTARLVSTCHRLSLSASSRTSACFVERICMQRRSLSMK
jgi:hypothetical protein